MQVYVVAREINDGTPEETPTLSQPDSGKVVGGVLVHYASIGQWGLYSINDKAAAILDWVSKPTVYVVSPRTRNAVSRWVEADEVIDPAVRTRINSWLTARGYPTIPAGWTKRQVVEAFVDRFIKSRWPNFSLDIDVHYDPEVD